ncbi:hypothetical protein [Phaeocystidibacter luteus]|uniref:Peptidase M15A C-terminal domain-containing protein n=1 Tax=Phaeocystidibacter luteus TaxID=911197 RepID=A0A6N6RLV2_9FLAO|nr:hypothetical protein [Phaeocystidibacter luteus]KAB2814555.1 hypothetical protein F8C67_02110 [Phaeocystidibacter luteus]
MPKKYKYFSENDFAKSKIILVPCSIKDMRPSTLERLDEAREYAGIPFKVTCGARSLEHELSKGRDGTTSHLVDHDKEILCKAVDLKLSNSSKRMIALRALLRAGFSRIGVYSWGLHVDDDENKPQNVMWYGGY